MADHNSNPARMLAPTALVVFAIAFFGVVLSSGGGGGDDDGGGGNRPAAGEERAETSERTTTTRRPSSGASTYTVKVGDTLGGIADKTGVPVERLLELNPELDPQALVSGQKIKLRE
jgi:LysM repeat protein